MPDPCEHVLHLGSALGNRSVASLLAGTQWFVLLRLALDAILKTQCFECGASLGTGIAFVGIDLLARITLVEHVVKVVSVMLAGRTGCHTTNKTGLVSMRDDLQKSAELNSCKCCISSLNPL